MKCYIFNSLEWAIVEVWNSVLNAFHVVCVKKVFADFSNSHLETWGIVSYSHVFCFFLLLALTILDTDARYILFLPVVVSLLLCSRSLPLKKCFLGENECTSFADFSWYLQKAKKGFFGKNLYSWQIDVSFSCVCLVTDHEIRYNIVEEAVDPRGDSREDLLTFLAMVWRNYCQ